MPVVERITRAVHPFDGDRTFDPAELTIGVVEVTTNSSSATVKTFPRSVDMTNSNLFAAGDGAEVIVYNTGANDLNLAANSGDSSFIVGDTLVPAGGFRLVKLAVAYTGGAVGIFCV
jgi:hypothetical protein